VQFSVCLIIYFHKDDVRYCVIWRHLSSFSVGLHGKTTFHFGFVKVSNEEMHLAMRVFQSQVRRVIPNVR
jgi:hypothetical protein